MGTEDTTRDLPARRRGRAERVDRIGRFVVLDRLGRGGLGVVYACWDPTLDRRVAVKILQRSGQTQRMLREAQAMARVEHPNVVRVYEAAPYEDDDGPGIYIAMELVDGRTLTRWQKETRRGFDEIASVFADAAAGLAAAHDAGLVHRDFKPANVLVSKDGDVKVLDFGLARSAGERLEPTPDTVTTDPEISGSGSLLDQQLTMGDQVMGTPAYLSPERYRGEDGDARSDQFAFAVSLYRAVYETRPFEGASWPEIAERVLADQREPVPTRSVPRWLTAIIERGLAHDPDRRFPDMHAVEAALRRERLAMARTWALRGGVGLLGLSVLYLLFRPGYVTIEGKADGPVALDAVWVDEEPVPVVDGRAVVRLGGGRHWVRVQATGFRDATTSVEVRRGAEHALPMLLEPARAEVSVDVLPRGATVTIDGVDHGAPLRGLPLTLGTHAVVVHRDNHADVRFSWDVTGPDRRSVALSRGVLWSAARTGANYELVWAGDLTGDGREDLYQRNFTNLAAFDPWKDERLWEQHFDNDLGVAFAFSDLDGDGRQDIVGVDDLRDETWRVAAWRGADRVIPLWERRFPQHDHPLTTEPLLTDLDGDGVDEVVLVGLGDARVRVLDGRTGRDRFVVDTPGPSLAAHADGLLVVRGTDGVVAIADGKPVWSVPLPAGAMDSVAGLVSKLTLLENWVHVAEDRVFVQGLPGGEQVLLALDRSGGPLWTAPIAAWSSVSDARVRDANGDGVVDVVLDTSWHDGATGAAWWTGDRGYVADWGDDITVLQVPKGPGEAALVGVEGVRARRVLPKVKTAKVLDLDGDGVRELVLFSGRRLLLLDRQLRDVGAIRLESRPHSFRADPYDADGDGFPETLIDADGPTVLGGQKVVWQRRLGDVMRAPAVAVDLDGDGRDELVATGLFSDRNGAHLLDPATGGIVAVANVDSPSSMTPPLPVPRADGGHDLYITGGDAVARIDGHAPDRLSDTRVLGQHYAPAALDGDVVVVAGWSGNEGLFRLGAMDTAPERIPVEGAVWGRPLFLGDDVVLAWLRPALQRVDAAGTELWKTPLPGERIRRSPVSADLDGDGAEEIVVATSAGLFCVNADGSRCWTRPELGSNRAGPVARDVDGDGVADLFTSSVRGLVRLTGNGAVQWSDPTPDGVEASSPPLLADLDDDGPAEAIVAWSDGQVRVLDARSGRLLWVYRAGAQIEAVPLAMDVDSDGIDEIIVGGYDRRLTCLRHSARRVDTVAASAKVERVP